MIFDHCVAPDSNSGNRGCDNMTLLIVGITHGRTKEGWYQWVKDRVKNDHGYKTPSTPPRLYPESRLKSYQARREALDAREKEKMKAAVK